jgi:hypothetical protein
MTSSIGQIPEICLPTEDISIALKAKFSTLFLKLKALLEDYNSLVKKILELFNIIHDNEQYRDIGITSHSDIAISDFDPHSKLNIKLIKLADSDHYTRDRDDSWDNYYYVYRSIQEGNPEFFKLSQLVGEHNLTAPPVWTMYVKMCEPNKYTVKFIHFLAVFVDYFYDHHKDLLSLDFINSKQPLIKGEYKYDYLYFYYNQVKIYFEYCEQNDKDIFMIYEKSSGVPCTIPDIYEINNIILKY